MRRQDLAAASATEGITDSIQRPAPMGKPPSRPMTKSCRFTYMHYRNLGGAGVKVSSLCLGAMTFGEADEKSFMHKVGSDEDTAHAVLDRAVEKGINFVDTADVYGQDGLSERVLGNWFEKRKTR